MITLALLVLLGFSVPFAAVAEVPIGTKELNFVFSHGAVGNSCAMQLLSDSILDQIPWYITEYERANPGIKVRVNTLNRCYPSTVDAGTWAHNLADSIDKYLPGQGDIILIGHSMGGKSGLYAVAQNVGGLANRTKLVVTIDSPIKRMDQFQTLGGRSPADYCQAWLLRSDAGVCVSVATYDSSEDGLWVSQNRHWLAFIAGESAPLSPEFDQGKLDLFPRAIDDGVVPIAAQYADGADVVYYGKHGHSEFTADGELAGFMSEQILKYIFGGTIECSVFTKSGTFRHQASGLVGTQKWKDMIFGDVLGLSGWVRHKNNSYTGWQSWEDVLAYTPPTYEHYLRSRYEINLVNSAGLLTNVEELRWLEPDNPLDFRVYIRTSAAPRHSIQFDWKIYRQELLPQDVVRDRYEVRVIAGTSPTGVNQASWASDNPRDTALQIESWAERPHRWFDAEWKVFQKESRQRKIIDETRIVLGSPSTP